MRTPATAPGDAAWTGSYGLGVQHVRDGDDVLFGHTGSMPGFLAVLMSSAKDGLTVAVQANAWSSLAMRELVNGLLHTVRDREPTMPTPWVAATGVDETAYELVGPWYWGAVAMTISLRADGDLHVDTLGSGGRAARFTRDAHGRWRGCDGYYHGEYLEPHRDETDALTHLDIGSFVLTRAPYAPGEIVPDGLDLGDWQL